jgi:hypothetical protein
MAWPSPGEHGIPDLSGLQASWLRFHLRTTTPLKLPVYKGSTFHGAFGWALRQLYRPLYDFLFESPPPPSSVPRREEHTSVLPKPFVLVPPLGTQCDYPPGSDLSCDLLLIGPAYPCLAACLCAFDRLGHEGLGKGHGRFDLIRVERLHPAAPPSLLFCADTGIWGDPGPPTTAQEVVAPWQDLRPTTVTLEFQTRLRLKKDNRLLRIPPDFSTFLERVRARLNMLAWAYHGRVLIDETRKQALLGQAKQVTIQAHDLVWDDWSRYSGRQREWMKFGGLLGSISYEGDLMPFMPCLALGEWLHVGGKTSFGLGKYTITIGKT